MKKLLILSTHLGTINRGAETFVLELVNYLKHEYEITIATTYAYELDGIIVKTFPVQRSFFSKLHETLYNKNFIYRTVCNKLYYPIPDCLFQKQFNEQVYEWLLETDATFDLLFVNNGIYGCKMASAYRAKTGTLFVVTGHGGIGFGEELMLKTNPDAYVALSASQIRWGRQYIEANRILHISNGIDTKRFTTAVDSEGGKTSSDTMPTVLCVGALTKFKRHLLAIDAVSLLDSVKLLIVGRGELREQIYSYGKSKLGDRFALKEVPYEAMPQIYKSASVFTLPSKNEPFGIVYLEALASGVPVVAPNDEVRQTIVGDAGILCDCTDAKAYAVALADCLARDWGTLPQKQAATFDWSFISQQYIALFNSIMRKCV